MLKEGNEIIPIVEVGDKINMEINRKHKYSSKLKNNYFVGYMNKLFNNYVVTNIIVK